VKQFGGNGIALDPAMAPSGQHVTPPLQANFAGQGLAHQHMDPGNLDV
jgi:hypothetical protein